MQVRERRRSGEATAHTMDAGPTQVAYVWVLDAASGETVHQLKLPEVQSYVYAPAFHPGNRTLAVGWRTKLLLFDLYPPESPLDPESCSVPTGREPPWAGPGRSPAIPWGVSGA